MGSASFLTRVRRLLRIRNRLIRECLAELLCTFVLITITLAGAAQRVTSEETKGDILTSYLAGALAVMVGIYIGGGISGAHMNPSFTLAMCLTKKFPWWKFPIFVLVEALASFLSAGVVYVLYYGMGGQHRAGEPHGGARLARLTDRLCLCPTDAIWHYSNGTLTVSGPRETASIFATYPADNVSLANGFVDQVIGTGVLLTGVMGIMDNRNKGVPEGLDPVIIAMLVLSIEVSMGANCGCPLNPTRDIGPRLFTYLAGWGPEVFSRGNGWWWVPLVAPLLGSAVGTYLYQLFVAFHYPEEDGDALEEQGSIILENKNIDLDTGVSSKEDTGGTVPTGYPPPPRSSSTVPTTIPLTLLNES
ncbi:PREDICTED: aquaporin-10 isoform X1 [Lepidothrix coronata]|uniref:Aquaporin-10 isoform X1 n=1 Tax=Lepidothrix coronata TaxID=321398 RepID=A0A6J0J8V2_9PASS|nr:PREDICTED: aquaporin-10 isoform X1 [Lepidothrix coronata]